MEQEVIDSARVGFHAHPCAGNPEIGILADFSLGI